jgi:hypothetical protein
MIAVSRRNLLLGAGSALPVAACGGKPGGFSPDPSTVDFVTAASTAARAFCGFLPTADTLAKIALALALPVATPIEVVASNAAHAFCDQVAPVITPMKALRQFRRSVEPGTGKDVDDFGFIPVNGKPVHITVYS